MTAETAKHFEALERQAAALMSAFMEAGCEAVAPAIIQPANVFLDVIGEDLRARTYVFTDPEGQELCLRPDLTVPTCRIHLARHTTDDASSGHVAQRYCYNGSVFRFQPHGAGAGRPNEFRQAGFELFGDADREQAETEALALVIKALSVAGQFEHRVRTGDLGLFQALLSDLDMPDRGRQRLRAQFWRPDAFRAALSGLTSTTPGSLAGLPQSLIATLDPADPETAEQRVADYLVAMKIDPIGARSVAEITSGLLAAIEDARAEPIPATTARAIEGYLKVQGTAAGALADIRRVLTPAGARSARAVDALARRLDLIAAAGIDPATLSFSAEFGRTLEYYTGFVFDVVSPVLGDRTPIAGGGRYDRLMRAVGAGDDIAAVGSAIHTERLLSVVNGGGA